MFFCVININAHGLHRLSYFKWFSHFIDRSKLTQIPNGYTCDVIPFLKTHNNDILHLSCVYNTPPSKFHIKILKGQITYSASFVRLSFYCWHRWMLTSKKCFSTSSSITFTCNNVNYAYLNLIKDIFCMFVYLSHSFHPWTAVHADVHTLGSCSLTHTILLYPQQQNRVWQWPGYL